MLIDVISLSNHNKLIQIFIYYIVEVTSIILIVTLVCKSFVLKLIVALIFPSKE